MQYRRFPGHVLALAISASASAQGVRLNGPLAETGGAGDVIDYAIDAAGERVIYRRMRADQESDERFELFRFLDLDLDEPLLPHAPPARTRSIVR